MEKSENVEIVRRGYEAFNATGRIDPDDYTPDFEFRDFEGSPQPMRRGIAEWENWARDVQEAFDDLALVPEELVDLGDHVLAVIRLRGRGRASRLEMDEQRFILWTLRDGKIAACAAFREREEALAQAEARP